MSEKPVPLIDRALQNELNAQETFAVMQKLLKALGGRYEPQDIPGSSLFGEDAETETEHLSQTIDRTAATLQRVTTAAERMLAMLVENAFAEKPILIGRGDPILSSYTIGTFVTRVLMPQPAVRFSGGRKVNAGLGPGQQIGLPVPPIIALIVSYAEESISVVDTVTGENALRRPYGLIASGVIDPSTGDPDSLVIADTDAQVYRRLFMKDFKMQRLAGAGIGGYLQGSPSQCRFSYPCGACPDPRRPGDFFLCDVTSIRHYDAGTSTVPANSTTPSSDARVTLVAGNDQKSYRDGVAELAGFNDVSGICCTADGTTLISTDYENGRLRNIDVKTRNATTLCGDGRGVLKDGRGTDSSMHTPRQLVFERTPGVAFESQLLVTSSKAIRRYNRNTTELTTVHVADSSLDPFGIYQMSSGLIIISTFGTHAIWAVSAQTGSCERLAGSGNVQLNGYVDGEATRTARFNTLYGLTVLENQRWCFVTDFRNDKIRRLKLPAHLFPLPYCCERDR